VLQSHGVALRGKLFDTMIAHSLVEPDMRHGMDYLSEVYLGYTPIPITKLIGDPKRPQISMADAPVAQVAEYSAEDADVTLQLRAELAPLLKEKGQERVFYDIESPLIPVLADMELEGIRIDAGALAEIAIQLAREMDEAKAEIHRLAGTVFNLDSPRQLGQVLFDLLKLSGTPRKTRTGQYATDEQTLAALAPDHEIVRRLLDYRAAAKLKSTYADALPAAISPKTGRVHTTFNQAVTATGRRTSPSAPSAARKSARPSSRATPSTCCSPPTIRKSSCASSPPSAANRACSRPSAPAGMSTPPPPPAFTAWPPTSSRPKCGAKPRW
jgi:DNA polymerase-1